MMVADDELLEQRTVQMNENEKERESERKKNMMIHSRISLVDEKKGTD